MIDNDRVKEWKKVENRQGGGWKKLKQHMDESACRSRGESRLQPHRVTVGVEKIKTITGFKREPSEKNSDFEERKSTKQRGNNSDNLEQPKRKRRKIRIRRIRRRSDSSKREAGRFMKMHLGKVSSYNLNAFIVILATATLTFSTASILGLVESVTGKWRKEKFFLQDKS